QSSAQHHASGVQIIDLIGQSHLPEVISPFPKKLGDTKRLADQVIYIAYGEQISVIGLPGFRRFRDRSRQSTADVALYLHSQVLFCSLLDWTRAGQWPCSTRLISDQLQINTVLREIKH